MKKVFCLVSLCFLTVACPQSVKAQYCWQEDAEPTKLRLDSALEYRIDMQATFSKGKTPLWLNANRYGLSSLKEANAYLRSSLIRPLSTDDHHRWGVGYGVDLVLPTHFTCKFIVQQFCRKATMSDTERLCPVKSSGRETLNFAYSVPGLSF